MGIQFGNPVDTGIVNIKKYSMQNMQDSVFTTDTDKFIALMLPKSAHILKSSG